MSGTLREVDAAADLDPAWDRLADSPFQRRAFLAHCQRHNPCGQRYAEWHRDGRLAAGAVSYELRLDLLTYARRGIPLRMRMLGVPASVSSPGVTGAAGDADALLAALLPRMRGLVVGLNLPRDPGVPGVVCGRTLPTMELALPFPTWDVYRAALRADYRRRLDRLGASWDGVAVERVPCAAYDATMHAMYQQVWRRSQARLEHLEPAFFRHLPDGFHLSVHRDGDRVLAWHVAATEGVRRWFFLGGVDDEARTRRAAYFNLLASIVREAIGDGMAWLDLGQTAEVPKARLGALADERRLFGWHRNALARWALRRGQRLLEYPGAVPRARVFKA